MTKEEVSRIKEWQGALPVRKEVEQAIVGGLQLYPADHTY